MSHWPDPARKAEFFAELEALVGRYPECAADDPDVSEPAVLDGFDPDAPKAVVGVALLVAWSNVDDWEEMAVLTPPGQSHYLKVGMLRQALHLQ